MVCQMMAHSTNHYMHVPIALLVELKKESNHLIRRLVYENGGLTSSRQTSSTLMMIHSQVTQNHKAVAIHCMLMADGLVRRQFNRFIYLGV